MFYGIPTSRLNEMQQAMTLDVPLDVSVHEGGTWAECEKG